MPHDIKVAWRFLARTPASSMLAVLTLAMAIAVCSVAAGTMDQMLWRPLDDDRDGRLVTIYNTRAEAPGFQVLSYPDYVDVRDRTSEALDLAAFVRISQTFAGKEWPARVQGELVSGNYFSVLSTRAYRGRLITAEDAAQRHAVVVIGYDFWRVNHAADSSIVGKSISLDGDDYQVVGVAPRGFHGPAYPTQYWIPLTMASRVFDGLDILPRRDVPILQTVGVVREPNGRTALEARIRAIETSGTHDGWRLAALPATQLRFWPGYRDEIARYVGTFGSLGACVLVIACANLAGLLLSRNAERQRDLAVRLALGASRVQLFRRTLAETVILALAGTAFGVWLAFALSTFVASLPLPVPVRLNLTPDVRLLFISIAVSVAASILFTAIFVARGLGADIRTLLDASGSRVTPVSMFQRALVVAQIAITVACLTAAGLLGRTALAVSRTSLGFEPSTVVMGHAVFESRRDAAAPFERLQMELQAEPRVESVALEWNSILGAVRSTARFQAGDRTVQARYNVVSHGYFATLRIPLVAGREFSPSDRSSSEPVAIINETLAAQLGGDAIGSMLSAPSDRAPRRIVGIARDVRYNGVTEGSVPFVYLPLSQSFRSEVWVHVRTADAAGVESLLRSTVHRIDPRAVLADVRSLSQQVDAARAVQRASARGSGAMAAIAMLLAVVGVYGLVSASIDRRLRELAIRAALGAAPRDIVKNVAREAVGLTLTGLTLGMGASLAGSSVLTSALYGVAPRDPVVFLTIPLVTLLISTAAWVGPARRAALIDPAMVLRGE